MCIYFCMVNVFPGTYYIVCIFYQEFCSEIKAHDLSLLILLVVFFIISSDFSDLPDMTDEYII